MNLKSWYKVVVPREDLREGRPLDASEFAVHLDKVRDNTAPDDYRDPKRFFDRIYLTTNLLGMGSEVLRRLRCGWHPTEENPLGRDCLTARQRKVIQGNSST